MTVTKEMKQSYLDYVYKEMKHRGYTSEEIPRIINKTKFLSCLEEYPTVQLHYDVADAVDEIIFMAAKN